MALTEQYTWNQDDPAAVDLAQARAMTLISMFVECEGAEVPFACPYDFTSSDGGWYGFPISMAGYSPSPLAEYISGLGWFSVDTFNGTEALRANYIVLDNDPTNTITFLNFVYDLTLGVALTGTWISGVQLMDAAWGVLYDLSTPYTSFPQGTDVVWSRSGFWTDVSHIVIALTCDFNTGPLFGEATIKRANVYGEGNSPC